MCELARVTSLPYCYERSDFVFLVFVVMICLHPSSCGLTSSEFFFMFGVSKFPGFLFALFGSNFKYSSGWQSSHTHKSALTERCVLCVCAIPNDNIDMCVGCMPATRLEAVRNMVIGAV